MNGYVMRYDVKRVLRRYLRQNTDKRRLFDTLPEWILSAKWVKRARRSDGTINSSISRESRVDDTPGMKRRRVRCLNARMKIVSDASRLGIADR